MVVSLLEGDGKKKERKNERRFDDRRFSIGEIGLNSFAREAREREKEREQEKKIRIIIIITIYAGNGVGIRGGLRTGEKNSWVGGSGGEKKKPVSPHYCVIRDDDER